MTTPSKKKRYSLSHSRSLWDQKGKYVLPVTRFVEPMLASGSGAYVHDCDGNRYLDLNSGQFCLCFGHGYPPFNEHIARTLDILSHTNTATISPLVLEALETLAGIHGGERESSIILSTGAEANECAFRFIKSITGRHKMISFDKAYHGQTLGTQGVSSAGAWAVPGIPGTFSIPVPDTRFDADPAHEREQVDAALNRLEQIFAENRGEIGAVIFELILGAGGMIFPPETFFHEAHKLIREHGALLVLDECQTGFGRTGAWFAYQEYGLDPDAVVFAKAAGAGFPVSGVTFKRTWADEMRKGPLTHFSSHQNDPLAAAALNFVVAEIRKRHLLDRIRERGTIILERLEALAAQSEKLVAPRGRGLMIGFNISESLFREDYNPGAELVRAMQERGVLIQAISRGRIFRVLPNYLIADEDIDLLMNALEEALETI